MVNQRSFLNSDEAKLWLLSAAAGMRAGFRYTKAVADADAVVQAFRDRAEPSGATNDIGSEALGVGALIAGLGLLYIAVTVGFKSGNYVWIGIDLVLAAFLGIAFVALKRPSKRKGGLGERSRGRDVG